MNNRRRDRRVTRKYPRSLPRISLGVVAVDPVIATITGRLFPMWQCGPFLPKPDGSGRAKRPRQTQWIGPFLRDLCRGFLEGCHLAFVCLKDSNYGANTDAHLAGSVQSDGQWCAKCPRLTNPWRGRGTAIFLALTKVMGHRRHELLHGNVECLADS